MTESASAIPSSEHSESEGFDYQVLQLSQSNSQQTSKKRYVPPRADSNTFPSQKAFLDSLQPMSIDEIDANSQKCPICWKPFGEESDPGFDNSELPVKLRCSHIFGNKCLLNTFGQEFRVSLKPLSFKAGSNGQLLGEKLHAFVAQHKGGFQNSVETFEKMIQDSELSRKGAELFGRYWWHILKDLQHGERQIGDITFLENAIIMDIDPKRVNCVHSSHESQHTNNSPESTISKGQALSEVPPTIKVSSGASPQSFNMDPVTVDDLFLPVLSSIPISANQLVAPAPFIPFNEYIHEDHPPESSSGNSKTWQAALSSKTNLDKLSALQKEKLSAMQASSSGSTTQIDQTIPDPIQETCLAQMAPEKDAQQQHADILQKQQAYADRWRLQRKLSYERRRQTTRTLIAQKLVDIYAGYQKERPLADPIQTLDKILRSVHTDVTVHAHEYPKSSYEIEPPLVLTHDELDLLPKDDEQDLDLAEYTFLVKRSFCTKCYPPNDDNVALSTPNELTWLGHHNSPDSCPLCHKVLFVSWRIRP